MENYFYIETYGCAANQNNSEIIAGLLKQAGYELTNNEKIADILIINTCVVKGKTEQKIKRRIQDLSKLYQNKRIIISGCMPETDFNSLKKINSKIFLLGIHNTKDIVKLIKDTEKKIDIKRDYLTFKNEEKVLLPKIPKNKLISITQISEGCLGDCTFCKVKLAKGRLFSYDKTKIIESIKNDLNAGAKEVWITSQDNALYGLDKNKPELTQLLKEILSIKKNFKLRIGMMNPNSLYLILDEMIDIYKNPKVYKFLHLPIQSASNKILKETKRDYKIESVEFIIDKFKNEIPNLTLSTDIISGYPTENEEDHKENLLFIKKFKPDVLNLSKFSPHKNTEAYKLKPLKKEIINKRTSELMKIHLETAQENKQRYKNKMIKVFVNSKSKIPGVFEARDENYTLVLINSNKSIFGKNVNVKIEKIFPHYLIGIPE